MKEFGLINVTKDLMKNSKNKMGYQLIKLIDYPL